MQNHIYYIRYALRFADMQIPELVTSRKGQTKIAMSQNASDITINQGMAHQPSLVLFSK